MWCPNSNPPKVVVPRCPEFKTLKWSKWYEISSVWDDSWIILKLSARSIAWYPRILKAQIKIFTKFIEQKSRCWRSLSSNNPDFAEVYRPYFPDAGTVSPLGESPRWAPGGSIFLSSGWKHIFELRVELCLGQLSYRPALSIRQTFQTFHKFRKFYKFRIGFR